LVRHIVSIGPPTDLGYVISNSRCKVSKRCLRFQSKSVLALAYPVSDDVDRMHLWQTVRDNRVKEPIVHVKATRSIRLFDGLQRPSTVLVLVVPDHRFPKLDLVTIRIHDPSELGLSALVLPKDWFGKISRRQFPRLSDHIALVSQS
jgi:hypothetical protein